MSNRPDRKTRAIEVGVTEIDDGVAVTLNGVQAKTPRRNPLVVPGAALAREIAAEIGGLLKDGPGALSGKGLGDPGKAPNYRIAAGAIDLIRHESGARERVIADLESYGGTDLVCFRADHPDQLVEAQNRAWQPLCDWFEGEFGPGLRTTTGLSVPEQDPKALAAIGQAIEELDDFALAALSLATHAAGSVVIGLALARRGIEAKAAFTAATVDETYQAEVWGEIEEARQRREAAALDLEHAARFLELLSQD